MSARDRALSMPSSRLRPGHPVLLCGADGPLLRGVSHAFVQAGARVAAALTAGRDRPPAAASGVHRVQLEHGPDGPARAYDAAERALGRPRTVVSLPDFDGPGRAAETDAVLSLGTDSWAARAHAPVGRTASLARLAVARGADAFVVVVGTPAPGARAAAEAGRLAVARSLVDELVGAVVRVHAVVVGTPVAAFRPAFPGGALMLDVAVGLSPADVGGLCVLLASDAGAAVASEAVHLASRADLLHWLGGR